MGLSKEERRLLHKKGEQPTYGDGKPNNAFGDDGNISYRNIKGKVVPYLKQNNEWVPISSSSDTELRDSEVGAFALSDSAFLEQLSRFRATIAGWGRTWVVHHRFESNFSIGDSGTEVSIPNYLTFASTHSLTTTAGSNVFLVPKNCVYERMHALLTTATNNDDEVRNVDFKFTIKRSAADFGSGWNGSSAWSTSTWDEITNIVGTATVAVGANAAFVPFVCNTPMHTNFVYEAALEQVDLGTAFLPRFLKLGLGSSFFGN